MMRLAGSMVVSFSCAGIISPNRSRQFWKGHPSNQFRGLDVDSAIDLLLALNVAKSLQDLSPLRSVGLHKLKGARKKQWAMTVNDRWRICFEFRNGDAFDVEIVDYHKG
jgi:toxin HigB-1